MIKNNELGNIYSIEGDYNYGRKWKIEDGWRGKMKDILVFLEEEFILLIYSFGFQKI